MKFLEVLVATPLAQTIGWTLIHSLWQGAIVSAALATALATLRSSRARYGAACVAMLVMLAGIGITFARAIPERTHSPHYASALLLPPWNVATAADSAASPSRFAAVVPWLVPSWMLGVWIFGFRQVAGWRSAHRLCRQGVCCAPDRWQNELTRLCDRLRVSRPVLLLESCLADVPVVIGHIRPVILMPVGLLTGLPAEQIEAILLHELAHVRRCDYLVNVMQRTVETLLFYHPAVWWISSVMRAERENRCDDVVVAISGNAHQYALTLAALEENRSLRREPLLAVTGGNLVNRIRRLLYPNTPNGISTPFLTAAILLATAVAAFAAWPSASARQNSTPPQQQGRAATSSYDKWLNEDVVYIISVKERAAFLTLATDEERSKFIEQFWERRNPHPGSPTNAAKEEHYRRIAYANQHFAAAGKAGWQTDRGHIYIVYGPPDEIDSHPHGGKYARPGQPGSSGVAKYPFEDWMYKDLPGIGKNVIVEFVDHLRNGDYEFVRGPAKSGSSASGLPAPAKQE